MYAEEHVCMSAYCFRKILQSGRKCGNKMEGGNLAGETVGDHATYVNTPM